MPSGPSMFQVSTLALLRLQQSMNDAIRQARKVPGPKTQDTVYNIYIYMCVCVCIVLYQFICSLYEKYVWCGHRYYI